MIFKTTDNGSLNIFGENISVWEDEANNITLKLDNIGNKISEKISDIKSKIADKINKRELDKQWSYDQVVSEGQVSSLTEENYNFAQSLRQEQELKQKQIDQEKEYQSLLSNETSSVNTEIKLSQRRMRQYDTETSVFDSYITHINKQKEQVLIQEKAERDYISSLYENQEKKNQEYISAIQTEIATSQKVQNQLEKVSSDSLETLGYKPKSYLKELREEQEAFRNRLDTIENASVDNLIPELPEKKEIVSYYDEIISERQEFQNRLNAIENTPLDALTLEREQYSKMLTEEADGQMALVMAENEGVSAKQKDIAETTSQIAAKEALVEASNKELLSNVNEKLAKIGVTSATEELTIAKLREIAASNEEGAALAKETLEMLGLGAASKATSIALKGLVMVGNMIAAWAIAEVLQLVVKGLDQLANSVDNCKERVDNLMSSYQTALDTANSHASRVEELASDYERLSKGVNNLGENVSLTSEEYEQYNSLVSEIADMFPTLIQGYNDQGIAILNLKGNVEGLRDAYKEAQTEAYNTLIASGENGDGNDIIKQWEDVHDPGFLLDYLILALRMLVDKSLFLMHSHS